MNIKVDKALERLTGILPLRQRQQACDMQIKTLHQHILRSFVTGGRIPGRMEMAELVSDLEAAVAILKDSDLVVFSETGDPVGAYPFTMEEREHRVRVNGHQVYAMCALDALAISPLFGMKTQISSRCRVSGDPISIKQSGTAIENKEEAADIHVGISWGAASGDACCADSLCMEMMFLRDGEIALQWLAGDPGNRESFTLQEAIEFGARFFVPLMS